MAAAFDFRKLQPSDASKIRLIVSGLILAEYLKSMQRGLAAPETPESSAAKVAATQNFLDDLFRLNSGNGSQLFADSMAVADMLGIKVENMVIKPQTEVIQ